MTFKFDLAELMSVFARLSVPYSFEEVNSNIFHVKIWHGQKIWIARFVKKDAFSDFEFSNWIEVK